MQFSGRGRCCRVARIADVYTSRAPERAQIASCVHETGACAGPLHDADGLVDGESFGDSTEVENERPPETHAKRVLELDVVESASVIAAGVRDGSTRKMTSADQLGCDRAIEKTVRLSMEAPCSLEHTPRPSVYGDRAAMRFPVHVREIARRIVKAHECLHAFDGAKCRVDNRHGIRAGIVNRDLDDRAEQRPRPNHAASARRREARRDAAWRRSHACMTASHRSCLRRRRSI